MSSDVEAVLWVSSITDSLDGGMTVHEREDQLPRRDVQHEAAGRTSILELVRVYANGRGGLPTSRRRYVPFVQPPPLVLTLSQNFLPR